MFTLRFVRLPVSALALVAWLSHVPPGAAQTDAPAVTSAPATAARPLEADKSTLAAQELGNPPALAAQGPTPELKLHAPPSVALYSQRDEAGASQQRECTGDCTVSLSPGVYRFALAYDVEKPVQVPGRFRVAGPDILEANYKSMHKQRVGGYVLLGAGFPLGFVAFVKGIKAWADLKQACDALGKCHDAGLSAGSKIDIALGSLTMAASVALGSWLASRRDHARMTFRGLSRDNGLVAPPLEPTPALEPAEPAVVAEAAPPPPPPPMLTGNELKRDDLTRVNARAGELGGCFRESVDHVTLLDFTINHDGFVASFKLSRELAPRVEKCLEKTLRSIEFQAGEVRSRQIAFGH